jgi:hypothetical protein
MTVFMNLLPYLLWIASLSLMLALFYGISRRVKRLRSRIGQCEARLQSETADLMNRIASLKLRLTELEEEPPAASVPATVAAGLDGTIRSKVLKMDRLGQSPDKIADALHLPKGEVELLVRVHRIVMRPYEEVSARQGKTK